MKQTQPIARFRSTLWLTVLAVAACCLATPMTAAADDEAFRPWLDRDGNALPFRSDMELLDFLRTARVVGSNEISGGINKPSRLDLELDGLAVRAIFRDVDVTRRSSSSALERSFPSFRDSYAFEVAAYEMSRMLGLDNVPPAILYEWRGTKGSLQLWVEQAMPESERIANKQVPKEPAAWHRQKTSMHVFDNLIYNFDRNHGNQLVDGRGKLWFIDHTRSFKYTPSLPNRDDVLVVDASLWRRLQELDANAIRSALDPYIDLPQMKALLKRHKMLVRHIQEMIEERGEDQVLLSRGSATLTAASTDG